jgi:hypothetical protein
MHDLALFHFTDRETHFYKISRAIKLETALGKATFNTHPSQKKE